MIKKIPDFLDRNEWILEGCTEFYYDPETEGIVVVKLRKDNLKEAEKVQKRLEKFFFAKEYVYRHVKKAQGGLHIRMSDKDVVLRQWGPEFNRGFWVTAVLRKDLWHILRANEVWRFEPRLTENKESLEKICFWLGDECLSSLDPPSN